MEFRILGPLEVVHNGKRIALGGAKQQALITLLALHAPKPVSCDRLIDGLWGERAPHSARHAVQVYISGIRTALRGSGAGDDLVQTHPSAYALNAAPDQIDARRFERLLSDGQRVAAEDPRRARQLLEEALVLWRGTPLTEAEQATDAVLEADRLDELRLAATESLVEIQLACGEHAELVGTVQGLVSRYPLRDQLRRQLMLALYRSGRQSEALAAYREGCATLDELGLLPSRKLRDLEQAILRHDQSLDLPTSTFAVVTAPGSGTDQPASRWRSPSNPPLIGRRVELRMMFDAYQAALSAHPPLLLISGEPGIGKTRLAEEFAERVAGSGAIVAWARCFEAEATAAYRPVVAALRSVVSAVPEGWLAAAIGPAEAAAATLLPELAPLADAVDPALRISGDKRLLLFDSVASMLAGVASNAPLVLVFDDVQLADQSSLALLGHVLRYTAADRILLVLTYRHTDIAVDDVRAQRLDDLCSERQFTKIELRGLDPDDVGVLVASISGRTFASSDLQALIAKTGGNPMFVREIAAYGPAATTTLPETISTGVRRRVARLGQRCEAILQLVAMTPGGAPIEHIARAADDSMEATVDAVESSIRGGLLRERVEPGMTVVDFVHPLFREAIEGEISAARRSVLHVRLADALESLSASMGDGWLGELAYHAFASGRAAGPARIVRLCTLAGELATSHTAFDAAALHYERALEAMSWDSEPAPAARAEIALRCAEAYHMTGDATARRRVAQAAFADAKAAGDAAVMARAALIHGGARSTYGVASVRMMELLDQSLKALESDPDDRLRARVISRLAQEHYHIGNYSLADELSRKAVALARLTEDDAVVAATMEGRIWALHRPQVLAERAALCDQMVGRATTAGDRQRLIMALIWRCCADLEAGNVKRLDLDMARLEELTDTVRVPSQMFRVWTMRATRAIIAGDYEQGMALALETYAIGASIEPENAKQTLAAQLLPMLREQNALSPALPELDRMTLSYRPAPGWRCALAFAYLEADLPEQARSELDVIVREGVDRLPSDLAWLLALCYLAEVAAGLAAERHAQKIYERLLPYADRNASVFDIASLGSVSHHLGLLARTTGRQEQAAAHLRTAIEFNDRTGQWPAAARSRYEYARVLRSMSESGAAEEQLERALAEAHRLKLGRLIARADPLAADTTLDEAAVP